MLLKRGNESRELLENHLRKGNVAAIACDTIYGLVGIVPESEGQIRRIKGRGETKPFLQLISDVSILTKYDVISPAGEILKLWPGPFTFVFPLSSGGTTAFRVPEDDYLRSLIRTLDTAIYSTSVNRAGMPPMDDPALIHTEFGDELALVEDSGTFPGRKPSTVVDLSVQPFRILRQGEGIVPSEFL